MADQKETVERRKSKRYKAIEGAYAAINPNSQKLGQIIDISKGGVCFKYIDASNDNQKSGTQQESSIFLSSIDYYVRNLHFKTVGDCDITNESLIGFIKVRKRHVQFTNLNFQQLFDLDNFLKNNTSGPVERLLQQDK
jgi:hypothetical protein